MKRYLTYLVLVALSSTIFFTAQTTPGASAESETRQASTTASKKSTNAKPADKEALAVKAPAPQPTPEVIFKDDKPADVPKATATVKPPEAAPVVAAPVVATPPAFDASNSATWPKCADNQIVRADNGQCADKPAAAPVVAAAAAPAAAPAPAAGGVVAGCGDNSMANYIYSHESGCNTTARNANGCYGIGQDCSGTVEKQCGADYACQNAYFTNYANTHCDYHTGAAICYGGWQGAYNFWLQYSWW